MAGTILRRPRIGLTTYWQQASWGVWQNTAAIVPGNYVTAVDRAGGTPCCSHPSARTRPCWRCWTG